MFVCKIEGDYEELFEEETTLTPKEYIKKLLVDFDDNDVIGNWITPTLFDNEEDMVVGFSNKSKLAAYNKTKKQWQKLLEY